MDDNVYHDIPRNVVNHEALMDDTGNDGDGYVIFQMLLGVMNWCLMIFEGQNKMKKF